jgi:hypothetical protein
MRVTRAQISETDKAIESAFREEGYKVTVDDLAFFDHSKWSAIKAYRYDWRKSGCVDCKTNHRLVIRSVCPLLREHRRDVVVIAFGKCVAMYESDHD